MAASIELWARGQDNLIHAIPQGSGVSFCGAGFGESVQVGQYQDTTWISDPDGFVQGPQIDNNKYVNASSVSVNGANAILLTELPNYLATLNVRLVSDVSVRCMNPRLRIYDRININNPPSGVTCQVASIVHPDTNQVNNGSGSTQWEAPSGNIVVHNALPPSPGTSGLAPNGTGTQDTRHDWYFALSATPHDVGPKTFFGLYFTVDYM